MQRCDDDSLLIEHIGHGRSAISDGSTSTPGARKTGVEVEAEAGLGLVLVDESRKGEPFVAASSE